jgi:hypothetical protein
VIGICSKTEINNEVMKRLVSKNPGKKQRAIFRPRMCVIGCSEGVL